MIVTLYITVYYEHHHAIEVYYTTLMHYHGQVEISKCLSEPMPNKYINVFEENSYLMETMNKKYPD